MSYSTISLLGKSNQVGRSLKPQIAQFRQRSWHYENRHAKMRQDAILALRYVTVQVLVSSTRLRILSLS
jgi:hypothetical protein